MIKALWFIFKLEFLLHIKRKEDWLYPLSFFVILICLFPLAFSMDENGQKLLPGCFWISTLFASTLSIQTLFSSDNEDEHLDQLLLSDMPFTLIIFVKVIAHWLVSQLPFILLAPFFAYLFHLPFVSVLVLFLSLVLGTPILTLLGSLMVALTVGLKQQGVLLGVMMFPLVTPVLIFGVNIVEQSLNNIPILGPLAFLAGIMVIALTFLPIAIAFVLRMSAE